MQKTLLTPLLALFGLALFSACASPAAPVVIKPTATATLAPKPTQTRPSPAIAPTSAGDPAHCTAVGSFVPTPDANASALIPPPSATDWVEGPADAPLTFIEYSDFQ